MVLCVSRLLEMFALLIQEINGLKMSMVFLAECSEVGILLQQFGDWTDGVACQIRLILDRLFSLSLFWLLTDKVHFKEIAHSEYLSKSVSRQTLVTVKPIHRTSSGS